jgi:hypothetical protein
MDSIISRLVRVGARVVAMPGSGMYVLLRLFPLLATLASYSPELLQYEGQGNETINCGDTGVS